MNDIAKALEFVADLKAKSLVPVKLGTFDPETDHYVIDGVIHEVHPDIPPRQHQADSLATLIEFVDKVPESFSDSVAVWFDEDRVVAVLDNLQWRSNRITLDLDFTPQFKTLQRLAEKPEWHEQKPFIRLLRIDLADTLTPATLLNPCRNLKWTTGTTVDSKVSRVGDQMGKSVNAAVSGEAEIPEEVTVGVRVFQNKGIEVRVLVRCAIEIDHLNARLQLLPFPGEIEQAIDIALGAVDEILTSRLHEGTPVYHGRP
jgi:hypothetical protein